MISGENLHFCEADSNMYIGRIHPPCLSALFFSQILIFWQKFPFSIIMRAVKTVLPK